MAMRLQSSGCGFVYALALDFRKRWKRLGFKGRALCARVPQERLGALLLLSAEPCFSDIFSFDKAENFLVR